MASEPRKRYFNMKAGQHPKHHQMGIGAGIMKSEMPDMMDNKTYAMHNEFALRRQFPDIRTQKPLSIMVDPTDYHSLGHKKVQTQHAGRDIESASFGHSKKHLSCGCGCMGVKQKHIDLRKVNSKANQPGFKAHPKHNIKLKN